MALVWDSIILCHKPVYAFNRYAISRSRLYNMFYLRFKLRVEVGAKKRTSTYALVITKRK